MDAERAARLRAEMVDRQLRPRGIADERVLAAMAAVPRERFVPETEESLAYVDEALAIESGQTISQPYIVARMTELVAPEPGMRVLEIGTGSGYQAAVLAWIGCDVVSVERHASLAGAARARLAALDLADRVRIEVGDGSLGWAQGAPYGGILVTAAAPKIPETLTGQLADGGRLVIPVGPRDHQELVVVARRGDALVRRDAGACVFVPLVGREAFPDVPAPRRGEWL